MMMHAFRSCAIAAMLLGLFAKVETPAVAQNRGSCDFYRDAVRGSTTITDYRLTSEWRNALSCLIKILDSLKPAVEKNPKSEDWTQVVRATGAARVIIANNETPGKEINPAVQLFRTETTLDATSTLSYAARTEDNGDARLNATLVLGNVIDNQHLCVPIDHLYDPKIIGTKGQANLLAVVSVVAPWAYKENYERIDALYQYTEGMLKQRSGQDDMKQTFAILDNMRQRLVSQKLDSNKGTSIPKDLRACEHYKPIWAGDKLLYKF
jgi:hypothetical protein